TAVCDHYEGQVSHVLGGGAEGMSVGHPASQIAKRDAQTRVVLGIDAAWTENQPSGVALVREAGPGWKCVGVAPSYSSFLALADGIPVDWSVKPKGTLLQADALIAAARELAGGEVEVISADIPLATLRINGRREADKAVSRAFASNWCSTHS